MIHDPETILALRRLIGDVTTPYTYTDEQLDEYLVAYDSDLNQAASAIWLEKAAKYAEMVDITEAGSTRKNSQLYERAIARANELNPPVIDVPIRRTTVRAITRA